MSEEQSQIYLFTILESFSFTKINIKQIMRLYVHICTSDVRLVFQY